MSQLFKPYQIGNLQLRNRFVRSATQDWYSEPDGKISDAQLKLYADLAAGGVGLIITAHSYVSHPLGKAGLPQNAIYHDRFVDGYSRLAEVVHKNGAKLFLQLAHAGRQTTPELIGGEMPIAPSDMFDDKGNQTARAMTYDDIQRVLEDYEAAAMRAKRAGLDGVQLHMAHGYLLAQFLTPFTNRRDDEYGGTADHRIKLLCEVAYRVKAAVGKGFPVFSKLNTTDGVTADIQLSLPDVVYAAQMISEHGIGAIETSGGTIKESRLVMSKPGIRTPDQEACFADAAKQIKANVKVPVILVGCMRSVSVMENAIASGTADMVSLSRPFIKEPDLVNRLAAGQPKVACVSCNACFNPKGLKCYYEGPPLA
jgi:2,4-dienoyl-CoA reductase-like NADH-dependent reductase (Old Yellow Enzyme family)